MNRHAALLRGVNVGGVRVAMADLRRIAEGLGWRDVKTLVNSGNLVFTAPGDGHAEALESALAAEYGRSLDVFVLTAQDLRDARDGMPFAAERGKDVHVFFCRSAPEIDADRLAALRAPTEALEARGRLLYLHAPEGIGRSKLAAKLDRVVPDCVMTARNLNTLEKLVAMTAE